MGVWNPASAAVGPQRTLGLYGQLLMNGVALANGTQYTSIQPCVNESVALTIIKFGTPVADNNIDLEFSIDGGTQFGVAYNFPFATINNQFGYSVRVPAAGSKFRLRQNGTQSGAYGWSIQAFA